MTEKSTTEDTKRRFESFKHLMESGTMQQAARMLNSLHPSEIADLLESLPLRERKFVWEMVDPEFEGEVLVELGEEVRDTVLEEMETEEVLAAVENLDTDDMADLILSLPEAVIRETLASMDKQRLQQVEAVLSYPEDTAGGLMELNVVTVRPNVTVDVVLRYLRRLADLPGNTDRLIVVDRFSRYLGTVRVNQVLTNPLETLVADLIDTQLEPIPVNASDQEVARLFRDYDLISAPVVDEHNQVLGRITIDDVVDVIVDSAEKSVMNRAGLAEDEDIFAPIVRSTRRRSVWLGANLVTAFIAAWVIGLFEATIQEVVALAVLMPIVASMGGIAGTQTLTLVVRAEALGQVSRRNARSLLVKELAVGFLNGLLWATLIAIIAGFWFDSAPIGGIIAAAIVINLIFAALSGVIIPFSLRKLKIDPALAGGVILTTVTDVVGFMAFLGIATLVLL
jgi:magnesium transporter